jgi:RNA polymerase-binding transcription factor DksA
MAARELNGAQRADLQQRLDRRETELREAIARLRDALAPTAAGGTDVRDSVEDGDARMMTSVDLVQLQRHEEELREVRHARDRMRQGDYGRCEECDEPIPFERLAARPAARLCLRHEEAWEKAHPGTALPS